MAEPLTPRPGRTLVAMTGSLSMIFLDATVVGVALPTIQSDLELTTATAAWVVNAFLIAFASSLAIGGRLADKIGRLPTFRCAILLFVAGSATCAFATSGLMLIIARAVQGSAAGLMQPASTAIVIGAFPAGQRGRAMATYFGVALLFLMAGPVIGGLIVQLADWPWIFWLNIPVATTALILSVGLALPARKSNRRGFDPVGAILLISGLPAMVLGLEWLGHPPEDATWLPIALAAAGASLTIFAVFHASRAAHPLLQVQLIAPRIILGQTLVLGLVSLIMSAQAVYGAIYLQEVLAFTPVQAGLGSLPLLLPVVLVIRSAGKTYDRIGSAKPVFIGLIITLAGLSVEVIGVLLQSYPILAIGMVLVGGGSTFASTPANTDVLSMSPPDQRGEMSGMVQTLRQLGGSIGIVICVLAISWTVAAKMPDSLPTGELGDTVRHALEGDVSAIRSLRASDPSLAADLINARSSGMAAAFIMQGIAAAVALLIAQCMLRPWKRDDQHTKSCNATKSACS
ncbi:MAG: MFS transporter [Phycisphaerales bacterium]|nr:MFS transporter [Phycisphaerales bacterium]